MTSVPTASNIIANNINLLVSAAISGGETGVETLIAATPALGWLEWPGVNILTNLFIDALANEIQQQTKNLVSSVVIDIQTNLEESAIAQAQASLVKAQAGGISDEIGAANSAFDLAMAALLHSDGSAS